MVRVVPRDASVPRAASVTPVSLEQTAEGFRSVQALRADGTMPQVVERYFSWLPRIFVGFVTVVERDEVRDVVLNLMGAPAIRLRQRIRTDDRVVYDVVGGWLAHPGGSFEFVRGRPGRALAILDGFRPRLPNWIYRRTHGAVHAAVMQLFKSSLPEAG